jgi:hypothetical protein
MRHDINTSNTGAASATVSPAKLRILVAYGVITGPLFVGVAALQALTRDGFDRSRHRLSLLSLGDLAGSKSQISSWMACLRQPSPSGYGLSSTRAGSASGDRCLRGGASRRRRFRH